MLSFESNEYEFGSESDSIDNNVVVDDDDDCDKKKHKFQVI